MSDSRVTSFAEPTNLLDTSVLNEKYAARMDNPYRVKSGTTRIPYDCVGEGLKQVLYDRGWQFLSAMDKQGWTLEGQLEMSNPRPALDDMGLPDLSQRMVTIRGVFKYNPPMRIIRTEFDPNIIQREPDQTISTRDALKALGLR